MSWRPLSGLFAGNVSDNQGGVVELWNEGTVWDEVFLRRPWVSWSHRMFLITRSSGR